MPKEIKMNEEYLERLGHLVDKAENYLALGRSNIPAIVLLDGLEQGIIELRDEIKGIYFDAGGDDVWDLGDYDG